MRYELKSLQYFRECRKRQRMVQTRRALQTLDESMTPVRCSPRRYTPQKKAVFHNAGLSITPVAQTLKQCRMAESPMYVRQESRRTSTPKQPANTGGRMDAVKAALHKIMPKKRQRSNQQSTTAKANT